jgi:hypothetical protein
MNHSVFGKDTWEIWHAELQTKAYLWYWRDQGMYNPKLYREIVGSLIYLMTSTRPDLCYIFTKLSQNMAKPTNTHLTMAKHVLRYLKGTIDQCLTFRKSNEPMRLVGFCDTDWENAEDHRSITGYGFQLSSGGPLISWKSRKQRTVALSTCEAEYMALSAATQISSICNTCFYFYSTIHP